MRIDIAYKTLAELKAFTAQDVKLNKKIYLTDAGKQGLFIYDSTDTTTTDNIGTVIVTTTGGYRYKRVFDKKVFVKWFKSTTDTAAITAAITYAVNNSFICVFETGTYSVTGNLYNNASVSGDKDLYLEFSGKVKILLDSASQVDVALIRYAHNGNSNVHIFGDSLEVDLNNECKGFIDVKNYGISGSTYVTDGGSCIINLSSLTILNTYADDTTDNSAAALWVDGTYERVLIENVSVNSVTRENTVTGDSKGILVTNTRANVVIRNCTVKNILTTSSFDVNADGISVFGLKTNGAIENSFRTGKALIDNCHFIDNQGRGVKIQTSKAIVSNCTFEHNLVITMPNSRDIDFQYGNGKAFNNTIIFKKNGSVSPLNEYHASIRWCAILEDEEMYGIGENNTFYTDVLIPYPFFIEHRDGLSIAVERSTYDVINNHIINTDDFTTTGCIGKSFVEFDALHVEQLETQTTINIRDNSYFSSAQPLLGYNSATGNSLGDKLIFTLENNRNTNTNLLPSLFSYSSGGTYVPRVNRYKIFNNAGFNDRVHSLWVVDFNNEKIIPHTEFVIDLATNTVANGRLLNAPAGISTTDYAFVKVLNEWEGVTYIQIYVHGEMRQYFYEWNGFSWKSHSVAVDSNIGQHPLTFTTTATTDVTLPTSGTLATLAGTESLTNKTVNGVTLATGGSASLFLNQQGNYVSASGGGGGNVSNTGTPTSGQIAEWTNSTTIQGVAVTGSGNVVRATSPALVTPNLGTPSAIVLTNATSVPAAQLSGTIPTGVLGASSLNIGTTSIALNRASASQALTGITSIDGYAAAVTLTADNTTNATNYPLFANAATGNLSPRTDTGFTYNPSTGALTATSFVGALTGAATSAATLTTPRTIGGVSFNGSANIVPQTIQSINEAADTTCFPLFISASGTQSLQPLNNTAFTFNASTGALGATTLVLGGSGITIGSSIPFSDSAGTLTLQNVDTLDATTESTIEAAIDTLANLTSIQGHTVTLTGAFVRSGAHSLTLTTTGTTNVTLPTTGTLATTSGALSDASLTVGTPTTTSVGYLGIPQNSQSTAYTCVMSDSGKHIYHPSADTTARTFTIPANSSVAYPIGTAINFINQNGGGVITIAITTDTMRLAGAGTTGSRTLAANGIATAIKITSTEWIISGNGLT